MTLISEESYEKANRRPIDPDRLDVAAGLWERLPGYHPANSPHSDGFDYGDAHRVAFAHRFADTKHDRLRPEHALHRGLPLGFLGLQLRSERHRHSQHRLDRRLNFTYAHGFDDGYAVPHHFAFANAHLDPDRRHLWDRGRQPG